ncbi:MYB-like protein [Sarocladium implicatum]|nr:MYB-like protein [Sarocladium implicatum]
MVRHSRHVSGSQNQHYMPVSMSEAAMYTQAPTRLSVPGNFFDTSSTADGVLQMPPMQQDQHTQDNYNLYTATATQDMTQPQHQPQQQVMQPSASFSRRASSGAWSREDDRNLIEARAKGLNWAQVKGKFPNKSANACRKRHERLMEHKDADDWDNRKLEQLAKEYMAMRREIWRPLADRCLSNGLKNLQSASRSGSRRDRLESVASIPGYDDDSGIGGIGLTPVDELDPSFNSPETSPSGSSSSGHAGPHHHRQQLHQQHHHHQNHRHIAASAHLQAIGGGAPANSYGLPYTNGYGTHHGYSSSVSSTASASFSGHPGSGSAEEQYYRGSRLGSSDMEIGTLINHSGGGTRTH